jgi:hypothetical protein
LRTVILTALGWVKVAALSLAPSASVSAHPSPRNVIQHRAVVAVGAAYIDVTLDLTFHEHASAAERARLDGDGDGRISRMEIESYLGRTAEAFEAGLTLTVDDTRLELVPLADPKLDLMGEDRVRPRAHALRLAYFARTPSSLARGGVLALRDALWPEAAALRAVEVGTTGGFRCAPVASRDAGVWRAHCQAVPAPAGSVPHSD